MSNRPSVPRPKRQTRRGVTFTSLSKKLGFVRVAQNTIGAAQAVVARVGSAILGGDFTGNARGEGAIDIQVARELATRVASGAGSVALGNNNEASGPQSVVMGRDSRATAEQSFALGVGAEASADYSVAAGSSAIAAGAAALALGAGAYAAADNAVAIGPNASADDADTAVIACEHLYVQLPDGTRLPVLVQGDIEPPDLSGLVQKSGDTMTGNLVMNAATIPRVYFGGGAGVGSSFNYVPATMTVELRPPDNHPWHRSNLEVGKLTIRQQLIMDGGYATLLSSGVQLLSSTGVFLTGTVHSPISGRVNLNLRNYNNTDYQDLNCGRVNIFANDDKTWPHLLVRANATQNAPLAEFQDSSNAVLSSVNKNGYYMTRKTAAPADAELAAGEMALWFDSTNGAAKLKIKARSADGTVVQGELALA